MFLVPYAHYYRAVSWGRGSFFSNPKRHWIFIRHFHVNIPEIYLRMQFNHVKVTAMKFLRQSLLVLKILKAGESFVYMMSKQSDNSIILMEISRLSLLQMTRQLAAD